LGKFNEESEAREEGECTEESEDSEAADEEFHPPENTQYCLSQV
jgi:hypothetical protein